MTKLVTLKLFGSKLILKLEMAFIRAHMEHDKRLEHVAEQGKDPDEITRV